MRRSEQEARYNYLENEQVGLKAEEKKKVSERERGGGGKRKRPEEL